MKTAYKNYTAKSNATPQSEKAHSAQIENNAGGFSFKITPWQQLNRFLMIGSCGGTYYVKENKLTKDSAKNVIDLIEKDGVQVVNEVASISDSGRAFKNEPAIFTLALCIKHGNEETKRVAYQKLTEICRIGTHLFHLAQYLKDLNGSLSGKGLRKALARFYLKKEPKQLAYEVMKYKQRDGWSQKDILCLSHAWAGYHGKVGKEHAAIFKYLTKDEKLPNNKKSEAFNFIKACDKVHDKDIKTKEIIDLIEEYNLPRETLPTEILDKPEIWAAMLPKMPITALIRNLGNMTRLGVLKPLSKELKIAVDKLTDLEVLKKGRVHPLSILIALKIYSSGRGFKGENNWTPISQINDALDKAFYLAFQAIEPSNKNYYIGLDISGSMSASISGCEFLSCREASAALAMVIAQTEPNFYCTGFTSGGSGYGGRWGGSPSGLTPIDLSNRKRLDDVVGYVQSLSMGGTDCALPMIDALNKKLDVDVFIVITDNETWAGNIHPHEALENYRKKMNKDAKLIVIGMTATEISIAKPDCSYMLDIAGFDASTPSIIGEFAKNNI